MAATVSLSVRTRCHPSEPLNDAKCMSASKHSESKLGIRPARADPCIVASAIPRSGTFLVYRLPPSPFGTTPTARINGPRQPPYRKAHGIQTLPWLLRHRPMAVMKPHGPTRTPEGPRQPAIVPSTVCCLPSSCFSALFRYTRATRVLRLKLRR